MTSGIPKISRRAFVGTSLGTAAAAALGAPGLARAATGESARAWAIVELRQYTLYGGRRDELVDVFEREFIESQDAVGAHVMGIFRDLDDPDRFVWLRGFTDMPARAKALKDFYTGPVWKAHNREANATMLDSSNVLLLHPERPFGGFAKPQPPGATGEVLAFIHYMDPPLIEPFAAFFARKLAPIADRAGAKLLATYASVTSPNTYPPLPIRERDSVFVWFAALSGGAEAQFMDVWRRKTGWRDDVQESLLPALMRKPEMLRLAPTARSPIR